MSKIAAIAAIQTRPQRNALANLNHAVAEVRQAARRGAQIVCLPELYRTPYFPQHKKKDVRRLAETIPGESTEAFCDVAAELGVALIVPLFEKSRGGRYYNSAVVINEKGKLLPTYRKLHLPQDPLFWEQNYFQRGDAGYRVYKTPFATFAVLICYDQWFPEAARMATLAGAEIIFYPTAIGWIVGRRPVEGDWHDAWETVMRGHAIANGVHVVAVNRVGREERLNFWGQSFACDSFGKVIRRASATREQILVARLDLSQNRRVREGWGFLRHRRPETYRWRVQRGRG
jgi:agmatine deiminase